MKITRKLLHGGTVASMVVIAVITVNMVILPLIHQNQAYNQAIALMQDEQYKGAYDTLHLQAILASDFHTVGVKNDGTVVAVGNSAHGQLDVSDWQL